MATPKQNCSSSKTDFPKLENQPTFSFHIFLPFKSESRRPVDRVGSTVSFGELWAVFVSQYLCSVRQKGNINSLQAILKREDESIQDFTRKFGQAVQQIDVYSMDPVLQNFWRSFGPTTPFFSLYPWIPPQP